MNVNVNCGVLLFEMPGKRPSNHLALFPPVMAVFMCSSSVFYVFTDLCLSTDVKFQSRVKSQVISSILCLHELSKHDTQLDSSIKSSSSRSVPLGRASITTSSKTTATSKS